MSATLIKNRKAYFNFEIQKTIEAGIELLGFEVKALKTGKASLDGAYVSIHSGQAHLLKMTISPYQISNTPLDYEPMRERLLLLSKKEIRELENMTGTKGSRLTLIPLSIYIKNNRIKVEIALARGKKKFDKRESIKKRESGRDIMREIE
jgi:SsrA-binding protein